MLLTITTTYQPATDLGYLLHKHPGKFQSVELSQGKAHIFYPEATVEKTTIALLLDIDPIELARGSRNLAGHAFALGQYVNDRPYVASSFMSVALSKAFSTAMNGRCKDKPELPEVIMPLEVWITSVPAPKGGEILIRRLFEPLGYEVNLRRHILDPQFPEWGNSKYFTVQLRVETRLQDLLSHLYVLLPVLDNDKHYWVSPDEVKKLLDKGAGWLNVHPEKEQITRRYLRNIGSFTRQALAQLLNEDEKAENSEEDEEKDEKKEKLHDQRLRVVKEKLKESGAKRVLDLGCGEGKLLRLLLREKQFEEIVGMDVAWRELAIAGKRLQLDEMSPRQKARIKLIQGSLTYRDKRLEGYDAAAVVEVIEHLEPSRLAAFERVLFEFAKPRVIALTTPNAEYNAKFETLTAGEFRHSDHRFEWTRAEFETWASRVAEQNQYKVEFFPVGDADEIVGGPSQMGVFTHAD